MKNFFEHQDSARQQTFRLVVLFALACLVTAALVYVVLLFGVNYATFLDAFNRPQTHLRLQDWWDVQALFLAAILTTGVVGGGTVWKINQLAEGGGSLVCEQLGGAFVDLQTDDPTEQRFINVVEEMAIASGVSIPLLYILDSEDGINAFAAGFTPNNAALAVSRGALDILDRDELQGVVAHEFSHILNGDMRLNIRMIGLLHGILMLATTGRFLVSLGFSGPHHRSSRRGNGGAVVLLLMALGACLFVIGYVGRFFGQLIQSAVSRQREYLADASAVQFTRNPAGLTGALAKIGGYEPGSDIEAPASTEISHLFFCDALAGRFLLAGMFSTHPPLKKRIRRLDPNFSGAFPIVEASRPSADAPRLAAGSATPAAAGLAADGGSPTSALPAGSPAHPGGRPAQTGRAALDADAVADSVGQTSQQHVDYARGAIDAIPTSIRQAAADTYSAAAVVFALLVDLDPATRHDQLAMLSDELTDALARQTRQYVGELGELEPNYRLALVELVVPALRRMSGSQHRTFVDLLDRLIEADNQVTLFEFCLEKLLKHRLKSSFGGGGRQVAEYYALTPLRKPIIVLLSCLARAGNDRSSEIKAAFGAGLNTIGNKAVCKKAHVLGRADCRLDQLDAALDQLARATNAVKKQIVDAAVHCALDDDEVTVEEAELLRAICEVLDVPMPPFLTDWSD